MSTEYPHTLRQFVLDTNVLIHDPLALFNFAEHDVVIPMTVLEELDHIKDSQKGNHIQIGREARLAIQYIEKVVNGHAPDALRQGVPLGNDLGNLKIVMESTASDFPGVALDHSVPDNRIIATALLVSKSTKDRTTVLVTKDINMRLKAKAAGIDFVEDYRTDQVLSDINYLSAGYMHVDSDWLSEIAHSSQVGRKNITVVEKSSLSDSVRANLYPNFVFLQDDCAWVVKDVGAENVAFECRKLSELMKRSAFGITPRNAEQSLALDAVMSDDIDIVFLTGPAGTGKTLIALAAALEMTVEQKRYDKIIVTRSVTDMDEGIGFLPGTEQEKMQPWLAAFTDALEVLAKGGVETHEPQSGASAKLQGKDAWTVTLNMLTEKASLQFKAVNFMRGRSIVDAVLIVDEGQNLTAHQMRSLITRVGPGTKIIVLGNLSQIDARYITALSSGLTVSVEKFKHFERGATVMLKGGVRSPVASFAEENF